MARRRVVVTGLGTANPLGNTVEGSWKKILEGVSGIGPITLFDAASSPVRIAGEVRDFDVTLPLTHPLKPFPDQDPFTQVILPKDLRRFGRYGQFGVYAGIQAYVDSGLDAHREKYTAERMGVNIGVGLGGLPEIQAVYDDFKEKGYRRITPFFALQVICNIPSGGLSILLNLKGPNHCNVTACASSAHSIGESFRLIERGEADVMLAGGAEGVICELGIGGFASMKALSQRNDNPAAASRPFDQDRDGFVMGEGATVLVLEEWERAQARGAKIYGELAGYGATSDAYHLTSPSPGGEGAGRAINLALQDAGIQPSQIDYVNAHATSTPPGDLEEATAIARVLGGNRKTPLAVSSTKSMTGHMLGAAGATEALFSLLSLRDQIIPPTANLEKLDPACEALGLNYVPRKAQKASLKYALSDSFGFGGTNGCLLFSKI
jgi:3-oxoacyl-[acyl-carrier-protein] synthase II